MRQSWLKRQTFSTRRSNQNGSTLIEVLISFLILTAGLLGLASLISVSMKHNQEAYYKTRVTIHSQEIVERIRANPNQADEYVIGMEASPSSESELANRDLSEWLEAIDEDLPEGAGSISVTNGVPSVVTVTVRWQSVEGNDQSFILESHI